jgi:hypothetical protein
VPYVFEDSKGIRETVKQSNYQYMIENYFVIRLTSQRNGRHFVNQIFIEDSARPHTVKATLDLLKKQFGTRIINCKTGKGHHGKLLRRFL